MSIICMKNLQSIGTNGENHTYNPRNVHLVKAVVKLTLSDSKRGEYHLFNNQPKLLADNYGI